MTNRDAKNIGTIYGKLCEHGAASVERLEKETKLDRRTIVWALTRLDATEGGGLYSLPDRMIPYGGLES